MSHTAMYLPSWLNAKFDASTGHDHDGSDSKKVLWDNLISTGAASGDALIADGAAGVAAAAIYNAAYCNSAFPRGEYAYETGDQAINEATWTDIVSKLTTLQGAGWNTIVMACADIVLAEDWAGDAYQRISVHSKLLYGSTTIIEISRLVSKIDFIELVGADRDQEIRIPVVHCGRIADLAGVQTLKWQLKAEAAYDSMYARDRHLFVWQIT